MRAIDGDKIVKILNECIDKILAIQGNLEMADNPELSVELQVYKDMLDEINEMPTIEPDQSPLIVEPEPCRIPFSTMQRVCKHRRTGGIVYGGDAKPRDACHYDMYRSLWDECSMRNCPILNRREIE